MRANTPTVFKATVLPPVLGPVIKRVVKSSPKLMSKGTTFSWSKRGWRPWVIRSRCWRIIIGRQQWSFWAKAALAPIRSTWAATSRELRMFSASLPTWPVRVRRIRSTSACSSSRYFLMSLFRFTTAMGSTNRVAPLAL